jgi:hypothetical protein
MISNLRSVFLAALLVPAMALHAAKISGTITNRTSGDPIAGARVIIGTFTGNGNADTATTNAKGVYGFDSVSTGFHSVVASMTGYQPGTVNVNAIQTNGTYTANISLVPNTVAQTGLVIGTVKDDSTKEAIKNATVILSHPAGRGGATPIDTVLTDGEGRFSFAAVPAASNYIVNATATGYGSATNDNVDVANRDTVTVPLTLKKLPKPSAVIRGNITDAASKAGIGGAMVILRKRASLTAAWTNVDTVLSEASGFYNFEDLAPSTSGAPYSLYVTKAEYNGATSAGIVASNGQIDTVNVALTKIAKGSLSIFVGKDSAGHDQLGGAEVAATLESQDGIIYTGATDSKGWVIFPSVLAGNYSVSANLAGFLSKTIARTVAADEKDTGWIYLVRATAQNSKSLSGLVRDADGKAIAGAKLTFEGAGANGIVLSATSTSTGDYSFSGIPAGVNGGTVVVQSAGYAESSGSVTLTGSESFLNVTLKKAVSIIRNGGADKFRMVRNDRGLVLEFPASASAGSLSLYDVRGTLLSERAVPAGTTRAALTGASALSGARFLILKQGTSAQRISLPAAP